jgi:hypothetical protein
MDGGVLIATSVAGLVLIARGGIGRRLGIVLCAVYGLYVATAVASQG